MNANFAIQLSDIQEAAERIRSRIVTTPTIPCGPLSDAIGCDAFFKLENLQHAGAFKTRGATNAILQLSQSQKSAGVVTHSSGNHGAALARAAQAERVPATIVMPHNSSPFKIRNVQRFGAEIVFSDPDEPSRQAAADQIQQKTGAHFIHPFNDPHVMAGQGVVALELLEQAPNIDTVIIPVGGGGLLSGCLIAIKALRPDIRVIAAEPKLADDAYRSWRSGKLEQPTRYDTIADGLRTPLGSNTFPIIHQLVDDILLVEEDPIRSAMNDLRLQTQHSVEPSGAIGLAAALESGAAANRAALAIVVTGGNTPPMAEPPPTDQASINRP